MAIDSFSSLELQTGFARAVGERRHASVVLVAGAVEHDLVDSLFEALLGDRGADPLGARLLVGLLLAFHRQHLVGDRRQRLLLNVVDDLSVDVAAAAEHSQSGPLRRPFDALAQRAMALLAAFSFFTDVSEHLIGSFINRRYRWRR